MDQAVLNGDLKRVQELVRNGADVNGPYGDSPLLHLAIKKGHVDIALAVLAAGANVHAKDAGGWTALRWACLVGKENVVQALIDKGSRVNERDRFDTTPLMGQRQVTDISMCLLRAGASCKGLQQERVDELLRYAWNKRDLLAIRCLFKDLCRVSVLSTDEQEGLLHLACSKGDAFVVRTLLKNGCRVSILSTDEQERLLHLAYSEGDVLVVRTLLKNSCRVSILSREEQEELLHLACLEGDAFVVRTLIQNSCSVKKLTQEDLFCCVRILSKRKIEELFHLAYLEGDVFVICTLLQNGCIVSILTREEQENLFHLACREGDVFVVRTLLENGCTVSILSTDEQENLFHLACHEGDVFVVCTLIRNSCSVMKLTQEDLLWCVHILSNQKIEELLQCACREGHIFVAHTLLQNSCQVEGERLLHLACLEGDACVVETLLASSCDVNCVDLGGFTPLMVATVNDHEEVMKKLILAGANLLIQRANSDTALHLAAQHNSIQCGILLAEGGASVRTKNNLARTPLGLASAEFKEAIKEAFSFTTQKALCIIGNAESGKSTLIAALQAESNSFIGKIINRFR